MLQSRKLQVLVPVLLIAGVWWMNHSPNDHSVAPSTERHTETSTSRQTKPASQQQASVGATTTLAASNSIATPRLEHKVNQIAKTLGQPETELSPELLDVTDITANEREQLRLAVMNQNLEGIRRRASMFLLTKIGAPAIQEIGAIALAPLAPTQNSMTKEFEVSLRITALETLDLMPAHSREVLNIMKKSLTTQKDPTLNLLARISISGIESGKPGKLSRAMDAMIKQNL
ncbi:MAG: hypothetical protein J7501_11270 [Bdellovibrio sp.]|nr:hypothetical protein [Bdellovibrio sp.]